MPSCHTAALIAKSKAVTCRMRLDAQDRTLTTQGRTATTHERSPTIQGTTSTVQEGSAAQKLPNEMLFEIFSHLDARSYVVVGRANHRFRNIVLANEPHYVTIVKQRELKRIEREVASLTFDNMDFLDALIQFDRVFNVYGLFQDEMAKCAAKEREDSIDAEFWCSPWEDYPKTCLKLEVFDRLYAGNRSRFTSNLSELVLIAEAALCLLHMQAIMADMKAAGAHWPDDGSLGNDCYTMISIVWRARYCAVRSERLITRACKEISKSKANAMVRRVQTTLPFGRYIPTCQADIDRVSRHEVDNKIFYGSYERSKVGEVLRRTYTLPRIPYSLQYFTHSLRISELVRHAETRVAGQKPLCKAALLQMIFVGARESQPWE